MGLDNGITIKEYKNSQEKEYEVCYWRKCWNIRFKILEILNFPHNGVDEQYEFPLTLDDVVDIYYMMRSLNKENWFEGGGSIWSWDEIKKCVKQDIKNLKKLIRRMKKDTNITVIFYDSY